MKLTDLVRPSDKRSPTSEDGRPVFAIGHIPLTASDVGALADFYGSIGFRKVARLPGVAILELRGGTSPEWSDASMAGSFTRRTCDSPLTNLASPTRASMATPTQARSLLLSADRVLRPDH